MNNKKLFFILFFCVFIVESIIKYLVNLYLEEIIIIKNIFILRFVQNFGAGFGLFQNQLVLMNIISLIVIAVIIYNYKDIIKNKLYTTAFALILAGTISNLIDRLAYGYVIDYLDFQVWPVFNIADSAITIGIMILLYSMINKK